jgi:hypothetical protein
MNKLGPKQILKYINQDDLDISSLLNAISSNCNLFEEIIGLDEPLASGVTTVAFKKDNDTVLCLSVDYNKVLYLKKAPHI